MAGIALPGVRPPRRVQRPPRWPAVVAALLAVALVGLALERLAQFTPAAPEAGTAVPAASPADGAEATAAADLPRQGVVRDRREDPTSGQTQRVPGAARGHAVAKHFERGVALMHAGQPEYAAVAFHEVLRLAPRLPEAHVNMGFALLAQDRPGPARDFFVAATELRREQVNAYYGLAVASEALGDMATALGAMRTYVHLAPVGDPFVRKGRAALWEWQAASGARQRVRDGDAETAHAGADGRGPAR
jgi:tetratricopeptide (TPR) repeat protein